MIDNTVFTLKNDSSICNPTENKFLIDCGSIFILLGSIFISTFKSVWAESQFIYWHEVFQKSTWSLISDLFSVKRYLIFLSWRSDFREMVYFLRIIMILKQLEKGMCFGYFSCLEVHSLLSCQVFSIAYSRNCWTVANSFKYIFIKIVTR